jgi:hypothetical protein
LGRAMIRMSVSGANPDCIVYESVAHSGNRLEWFV